MGRKPCCPKEGLNRGAWTSMEDDILVSHIKKHGEGKWGSLPKRAGLRRCGKSCRLRWLNYLRPGIKRGNISDDEEELIIRLHRLLGNRWSLIAGRLPGRTDNEIKNYWNTTLGKKLLRGETTTSRSTEHHQASASSFLAAEPIRPTTDAAAQPEPASPVRTQALRCTSDTCRLPVLVQGATGHGEQHSDTHVVDCEPTAIEAEGQPQDCLTGDDCCLPIDLGFDMDELGFLSPWGGSAVADGVGTGDYSFWGDEVDLEPLLTLVEPGGHGGGVPSPEDMDFAWF